MLHKNTVQYRIGKAEESLGRSGLARTATTSNSRCASATRLGSSALTARALHAAAARRATTETP